MKNIFVAIVFILGFHTSVQSQGEKLKLTLQEAIALAQEKSPDILTARENFRSSYWQYRSFRADYLPSLSFSSNPTLNRSINKITLSDGSEKYVEQQLLTTNASLSIGQNIAFTGGTLTLNSSLDRLDLLSSNTSSYKSNLITVGYSQNLFGYNSMKWAHKTEPLYYQRAKKTYVESLELVASQTTNYFFNLALAQTNWDIASYNYANADTLYRVAQGRYDIGITTENDMLQHEIQRLSEENNMMNAQIEVENNMQTLRSYLGIKDDVEIELVIDDVVPQFTVNIDSALRYAYENNPDLETMELRRIEADRSVSYAKSEAGLKASIYLQFGLTQTGERISESYRDPLDQQYASINLSLPILDWGRGRGKVKMAKSGREAELTRLEQDKVDFEQNIIRSVKQFNLQAAKVLIANKTDQTSERRHTIARQLYITGKSTILDLNSAISERDSAKRGYISSLASFWSYYYLIRSLTLFDFEKHIPITEDYSVLMK